MSAIHLCLCVGQYYQKTAGSSATVSINTTNIALGKHLMEVLVYRRGHRTYVPVATASAPYVVTGECAARNQGPLPFQGNSFHLIELPSLGLALLFEIPQIFPS